MRASLRLTVAGCLLATGCAVSGIGPADPDAPSSGQGSARAADALSVNAPRWMVGDRWVISWQNPRNSGTTAWTVDREQALDGVDHYVIANGPWNSFWRKKDLAFHLDQVGGSVVTRYDPPQARYTWPLHVGKRWIQSYRRDDRRRDLVTEVAMECHVESAEMVTVPAGVFPTLKIVCRNQGSDTIMHETWYAPAVKNWVRERGRFAFGIQERELLAFSRSVPSGIASTETTVDPTRENLLLTRPTF